jgi:hypothetical protein
MVEQALVDALRRYHPLEIESELTIDDIGYVLNDDVQGIRLAGRSLETSVDGSNGRRGVAANVANIDSEDRPLRLGTGARPWCQGDEAEGSSDE